MLRLSYVGESCVSEVNVVWVAFILVDASMSGFWYVQELDGMVHHPCYPQVCLGIMMSCNLGRGLMCLPMSC